MAAMQPLADYMLLVAPGIALFAACLAMLPMKAAGMRIALYIAIFILIRDAMTPAGLWSVDAGMRLGFHPDPPVLASLGLASLAAVLYLLFVERGLRPLLVWSRGRAAEGLAAGLAAGCLLALPLQMAWGFPFRQFAAGPAFVAGLLMLAFLGNLLEEVLFRGYLQGHLEKRVTPLRAAILSGVLFAACHGYLAITVTDAGWPVLAFTLAEGIACGLLALRYGVVSATLAHGTAIFLIAAPMAAG